MKKLLIQGASLASLMFIISGCTHTSNLNTSIAKPELNVYQTDIKGFREAATKHFKSRGYIPAEVDFQGVPGTIVKVDDLVFEQPNRQASSFIGSPSCARIYLNVKKTPEGYITVAGETYQVGNCHTPFENVVTSRSHYSELQWDLNKIQRDLQVSAMGSAPSTAIVTK